MSIFQASEDKIEVQIYKMEWRDDENERENLLYSAFTYTRHA